MEISPRKWGGINGLRGEAESLSPQVVWNDENCYPGGVARSGSY